MRIVDCEVKMDVRATTPFFAAVVIVIGPVIAALLGR
jgi:uncharacterized membrane protein